MMENELKKLYPNRIIAPLSKIDIPDKAYLVYILLFNNKPIVLGHGKKNRASVIFDNEDEITPNHIKALFVRLYVLYGSGEFNRYIIVCEDKNEAKTIEKNLHLKFGGNKREIPIDISNKLFANLNSDSIAFLFIMIALNSSFDGISDIKKWQKIGLLKNEVLEEISTRLKLKIPLT